MDLVSLCPFPVQPLFWHPAEGRTALTIVAKATFVTAPGESVPAAAPEPIAAEDRSWTDSGAATFASDGPDGSVWMPHDLAPLKLRADVLVVGHAYARGGAPVDSLVARIAVGRVDKSIEVHGSRVRSSQGAFRAPKRALKLPLAYERAAGGPGTDNPVGLAPGARDTNGNLRLPSLVPVGFRIDGDQWPPPIGFGPIAPSWPPRAAKAPPAHAFGWDVDPAYHQVAPPDQQTAYLRPKDRITLEHLHPKHPRLVTRVPLISPVARVEPSDGAPMEVPLLADTLWIDTRRGLFTITYRGHTEVSGPAVKGVVFVRPDAPAPPAQAPPAPLFAPDRARHPAPQATHSQAPYSPSTPVAPPPLLLPEPVSAAGTESQPTQTPSAPPQKAERPPPVELVWVESSPPEWPDFGDAKLALTKEAFKQAISGAPLTHLSGLEAALARAEQTSPFSPPHVLAAGTLEFGLDPLLALQAICAASVPLAGSGVWGAAPRSGPGAAMSGWNKKLREHLDLATSVLKAPALARPDFFDALGAKIREALIRSGPAGLDLGASLKDNPADPKSQASARLLAWIEKPLLEARAYDTRALGGFTWVRAVLRFDERQGPEEPLTEVPVYLPESAAKRLPLFRRFSARVYGQVLWSQDQFERAPVAMIARAVGRISPRSRHSVMVPMLTVPG